MTFNAAIPENAKPGFYISAQDFAKFQKAVEEADKVVGQTYVAPTTKPMGKPGPGLTQTQVQEIMAKGVTPEVADQMFTKDVLRNEAKVKQILSSVGVKKIPQGAFDGLVSMQNQLGDISYAFVKGEKIDLTPLYRAGDWQRVASFIAADERDRSRRIREAAMIARNDYGPQINPNLIIKKGLDDAKERLAKEQLNKQTNRPPSGQQVLGLANSYFATEQKPLPNASKPLKLASVKNYAEEYITKRFKKQTGPWPY